MSLPVFAQTNEPGIQNHVGAHENNRERIIRLEERQDGISKDIEQLQASADTINAEVQNFPAYITVAALVLGSMQYLFYRKVS